VIGDIPAKIAVYTLFILYMVLAILMALANPKHVRSYLNKQQACLVTHDLARRANLQTNCLVLEVTCCCVSNFGSTGNGHKEKHAQK
jgi:hypothetical protein